MVLPARRPDEVRLHERNSLRVGDRVQIMSREWIVVAEEQSMRPDVAARRILAPAQEGPRRGRA